MLQSLSLLLCYYLPSPATTLLSPATTEPSAKASARSLGNRLVCYHRVSSLHTCSLFTCSLPIGSLFTCLRPTGSLLTCSLLTCSLPIGSLFTCCLSARYFPARCTSARYLSARCLSTRFNYRLVTSLTCSLQYSLAATALLTFTSSSRLQQASLLTSSSRSHQALLLTSSSRLQKKSRFCFAIHQNVSHIVIQASLEYLSHCLLGPCLDHPTLMGLRS